MLLPTNESANITFQADGPFGGAQGRLFDRLRRDTAALVNPHAIQNPTGGLFPPFGLNPPPAAELRR